MGWPGPLASGSSLNEKKCSDSLVLSWVAICSPFAWELGDCKPYHFFDDFVVFAMVLAESMADGLGLISPGGLGDQDFSQMDRNKFVIEDEMPQRKGTPKDQYLVWFFAHVFLKHVSVTHLLGVLQ